MVVNAAEAPNNCQPAKKYGVTECNIRRWQIQKKRLKTLTVREKLIVVLFQEIDRRVCEFVIEELILVKRVFF